MKSILVSFAVASAVASAALPTVAFAKDEHVAKSVVIVHGAFADASGWDKVVPILQAKGLNVVAVQNPLSSLANDVDAAARAPRRSFWSVRQAENIARRFR